MLRFEEKEAVMESMKWGKKRVSGIVEEVVKKKITKRERLREMGIHLESEREKEKKTRK